jgi:hypothetical protein
MNELDSVPPEQEFVVLLNALMVRGIKKDADPELMAQVCVNTARELYDHYGAGEDELTFHEFVVSAGFEAAEVEEWLDSVEDHQEDEA